MILCQLKQEQKLNCKNELLFGIVFDFTCGNQIMRIKCQDKWSLKIMKGHGNGNFLKPIHDFNSF